jgi:hypothetical protein
LKNQLLSLAIRYAGKSLAVCLFLILFAGNCLAANYDWVGTVSNDWATPQNWRKGNATQGAGGNYPGQIASNDVVRIGLNNNFTTANSPVLSTALTRPVSSIEFGDNNGVAMTLTINTGFTLTVSNGIVQDNNSGTGGITTTIMGAGTLSCDTFDVGDGTNPSGGTNSTTINSDINSLVVTGALTLNSTSPIFGAGRNNPVFNLNSGTLSVDNITTADARWKAGNSCTFKMNIGAGANTLILLGTSPFGNLDNNLNIIDMVSGGTGQSLVIYGKTTGTQNIYTNTDGTADGINITPTMYPNLTFSGASTKSVRTGTLTVGGDWNTGGGTVNLTANDPALTVAGDWTNTAPITMGLGTVTITGDLNNTSNTITGNTAAATLTVNGALTNGGTIAVGTENMTFALASTNTGTYTGGAGTSKFTAGLTNTGTGTINESSGTFTIGNFANNTGGKLIGYNTATAATNITGTLNNAGTITANKEVITCTGAATNTGTFTGATANATFNGTFTMTAGTFTTGTGDVTFNDDYGCSGGTFTASSGDVTFKAGYSNTGTGVFNPPTTGGNIILSGTGNQTLTDNSAAGTLLSNAQFLGGGTKTLVGTKGFFLETTGILSVSGNTTLATGSVLTLKSDANSSATISSIPAGCFITGTINVERFIKGGAGKRGYRLVGSTVYTGTIGTVNVFDLKYLSNTLLVSGPASGGFNVTTTKNPSIYLFREDATPPPSNTTVFTTGYNWKGVGKIDNSPLYNIGTQKKLTPFNVVDTTVTIPVGNGLLVFDRGDNTSTGNGTTAGTKTTAPFNNPEDLTLTETGTLNTHTINVVLWYAGAAALGSNLSYTSANLAAASSLTAGYNLVANPYPSTINWEKFNRNGTVAQSSIYGGGGLPSTIWMFNQSSKQYESYKPKTTVTSTADTTTSINPGTASTGNLAVSNMIASGQAFFVVANAKNQSLSFRETAKTNTQPTATRLNKLLGKPKESIAQVEPLMHFLLKKDSIDMDGVAIRMSKDASTKFNIYEDAKDMGGDAALVSLSALSSDSVALSIDYTSFPGKQEQTIPLFVDATDTGPYQLSMTDITDMPQLYAVWLKDSFTNDSLDLKKTNTYPFTIDKSNAATFGNKRFTIVIRQDSAYAYKLLDFTATKINYKTDVQLVWKTQNEGNYTRFTVERSTDNGKTFDVLGGMLSTGAGTYSLSDKNPDRGQNLYRLKQEDVNNTVTYSKVVRLQFSGRGNSSIWDRLSIYPNPASHNINLAIDDKYAGNTSYTIRFVNSYGTVVKQINCSDAEWHGNISNLRPGTYLVRVINNRTQNLIGENKFVKL